MVTSGLATEEAPKRGAERGAAEERPRSTGGGMADGSSRAALDAPDAGRPLSSAWANADALGGRSAGRLASAQTDRALYLRGHVGAQRAK